MSLKSYLAFAELPTKIASIIPFLLGYVYTLYKHSEVHFFYSD